VVAGYEIRAVLALQVPQLRDMVTDLRHAPVDQISTDRDQIWLQCVRLLHQVAQEATI
jgi:hypothetical protein